MLTCDDDCGTPGTGGDGGGDRLGSDRECNTCDGVDPAEDLTGKGGGPTQTPPPLQPPGTQTPYIKDLFGVPVWVPEPGQTISPLGKGLIVSFGLVMEVGLIEAVEATTIATAATAAGGQLEVAVPLAVLDVGEIGLSIWWLGTLFNIAVMPTS